MREQFFFLLFNTNSRRIHVYIVCMFFYNNHLIYYTYFAIAKFLGMKFSGSCNNRSYP